MESPPDATTLTRKPWYRQLYLQVLVGFFLGILIGLWIHYAGDAYKSYPDHFKFLPDVFIKLIRMLLAPIIAGTVVLGIVQMGNLKEVGRVGLKAILYFEVVTTIALVIGLIVVNYVQPGQGMNTDLSRLDTRPAAGYTAAASQNQTFQDFLLNIIPSSIADAFVTGNMLQVIFFSVLFALAVAVLPNRGKPVVEVIDTVVHALFVIVRSVMFLAPLAALGGMAYAVGKYGPDSLLSYLKLIACLYLTSGAFIFIVLGIISSINGISLWKFLIYIKDEILITFATASTETVFPRMLKKLEHMGCSKSVVGLVLPAGYTFNADGGCIYMTMAAIFLAQATNTHLSLRDQLVLMAVCLFTTKGAAGVAGAGFIALAATLSSMKQIPVESLVLLLGVDRFLNEARSVTNLIGNGIATITVARWENALDLPQARRVLNGETEAQSQTTV